MRVHKYPVPGPTGRIEMPYGARIVHVDFQDDVLTIWGYDHRAGEGRRALRVGTGWAMMATDWRPPTSAEVDEFAEDAYRQGLEGAYTDEDGTDWERLLRLYERPPIDLGNDANGPAIRRIKSAYRLGLREEG